MMFRTQSLPDRSQSLHALRSPRDVSPRKSLDPTQQTQQLTPKQPQLQRSLSSPLERDLSSALSKSQSASGKLTAQSRHKSFRFKSILGLSMKRAVMAIGQDKTVLDSARSISSKFRYSAFDPQKPPGKEDKLTLVAHGSEKHFGKMNPHQLVEHLRSQGITGLKHLSLKGCHSAQFAQELFDTMVEMGFEIQSITGRTGAVAIQSNGSSWVQQGETLSHKGQGTKIRVTQTSSQGLPEDPYRGRISKTLSTGSHLSKFLDDDDMDVSFESPYLNRIRERAEASGRWDEDFVSTFDAIDQKRNLINDEIDTLYAFYHGDDSQLSPRERRIRNRELQAHPDGGPTRQDLFNRVIGPSFGILSKHEYNVLNYCNGARVNRPGSSSMGSLHIDRKTGAVSGRPSFSSLTQSFVSIKAGQHRRHIMAWHNIRNLGTNVIARRSTQDMQRLLHLAPPTIIKEVSTLLKVDDIRQSKDPATLLKGIMFVMNSNPNNLWAGDGKENSAIAGAWSALSKQLATAGDNLASLTDLRDELHARSQQGQQTVYRTVQRVAAQVIHAELQAGSSAEEIRNAVLETVAGLEIDAISQDALKTKNIFKHQLPYINIARQAYLFQMGQGDAPSIDDIARLMVYPPGYSSQEAYSASQVNVDPIEPPEGVTQAGRSQFAVDGGHTACTAMALMGIRAAFDLGQYGDATPEIIDQTLSNGRDVFQAMYTSPQNILHVDYFHPYEIPDNTLNANHLDRRPTETISHNGHDVRDRVRQLLNANQHMGISLVMGGATVSIIRNQDRYFVYDSHGFESVTRNAFLQEFDNLNAASDLIEEMVQRRVADGRDVSITPFVPT